VRVEPRACGFGGEWGEAREGDARRDVRRRGEEERAEVEGATAVAVRVGGEAGAAGDADRSDRGSRHEGGAARRVDRVCGASRARGSLIGGSARCGSMGRVAWREAVEPYVMLVMWMSPGGVALLLLILGRWLQGGSYRPFDMLCLGVGLPACVLAYEWLRAMMRDEAWVAPRRWIRQASGRMQVITQDGASTPALTVGGR